MRALACRGATRSACRRNWRAVGARAERVSLRENPLLNTDVTVKDLRGNDVRARELVQGSNDRTAIFLVRHLA